MLSCRERGEIELFLTRRLAPSERVPWAGHLSMSRTLCHLIDNAMVAVRLMTCQRSCTCPNLQNL